MVSWYRNKYPFLMRTFKDKWLLYLPFLKHLGVNGYYNCNLFSNGP